MVSRWETILETCAKKDQKEKQGTSNSLGVRGEEGGAKEGGGRIAEEEVKRREGKEHESNLTCSARVNDYGEELQRELGYSIGKEGLGSLESPSVFTQTRSELRGCGPGLTAVGV